MRTTLGLTLFGITWALAATIWPPHVLPGPGRVLQTTWTLRASFAADLGATLGRVLTGYGFAVLLALPTAAAMRHFAWLDTQLGALLSLLRTIPPFAWAPLLLLWIGIGDTSAAMIVGWGAFFPILRSARAGLDAAPSSLLLAAENLGASRGVVLRRVALPAAVPLTVSGLRLGWSLAWMSVVAAELAGADGGLGQRILDARNLARPDIALASMVIIGAIAALSDLAFARLLAHLGRWRDL